MSKVHESSGPARPIDGCPTLHLDVLTHVPDHLEARNGAELLLMPGANRARSLSIDDYLWRRNRTHGGVFTAAAYALGMIVEYLARSLFELRLNMIKARRLQRFASELSIVNGQGGDPALAPRHSRSPISRADASLCDAI